jgi:hypothetical protein
MKIKPRRILGLSIVSPLVLTELLFYRKTGGTELLRTHACLGIGLFLQTGLLAHSAADDTLSAEAKSSDHVRHFSLKFQGRP